MAALEAVDAGAQRRCRLEHQIAGRLADRRGKRTGYLERGVGAELQADDVANVGKGHQAFQLVIAVGAAADDAQGQVYLGGSVFVERGQTACLSVVMAGLVPAIHALLNFRRGVDARDKPGHDMESFSRRRRPSSRPWPARRFRPAGRSAAWRESSAGLPDRASGRAHAPTGSALRAGGRRANRRRRDDR